MIVYEFAEAECNARNRKRYESKGYIYDESKSVFLCKVSDLTKGSRSMVYAQCEICGIVKRIQYKHYRLVFDKRQTYCCGDCNRKVATPKIMLEKHGVENAFSLDSSKQKSKETMIKKYGVPYNMQREEMKQEFLVGDKNNFWVDGRNRNSLDRNNSQLKTWRKQVWARDDYTCIMCKHRDFQNKGKSINAHHFEGYLESDELRYNVSNGITLCLKCHIRFHKRYGFGENDFWQYLDWIADKSIDHGRNPSTVEDELPLEAHNVSDDRDDDMVSTYGNI